MKEEEPTGPSSGEDKGPFWMKEEYWTNISSTLSESFAGVISQLYSHHDADESRDKVLPLPHRRAQMNLRYRDITWMLQNPNPYNTVRGRHDSPHSLSAVRSLISLIPVDQEPADPLDYSSGRAETPESLDVRRPLRSSKAETASQLSEGTIRALRDLELAEALELNRSLRFWAYRWDRPFLSWLEAGPWVWFSPEGYNHESVGQKVSQIQAVLARRVGAIGELQQHLLRAGWRKGVASWAMLGEGGQWSAVAGFDGGMGDEDSQGTTPVRQSRRLSSEFDSMGKIQQPAVGLRSNESITSTEYRELCRKYYGNAEVFVDGQDGGRIQTDDPSLAAWSVDAMRLVRGQLFRAGNGVMPLPFVENWVEDAPPGHVIVEPDERSRFLPKWASAEESIGSPEISSNEVFRVYNDTEGKVEIDDLPLMVAEVSQLLDSMEAIMDFQRSRRLEKLKAMPRLRRNWYVYAAGAPVLSYVLFKLARNGYGKEVVRFVLEKIQSFYREHLWGPLQSIFSELFSRKGRESISDHEARIEVIESLKKMIKSWLDDTFPLMDDLERQARAERMDMSLIEQRKEENMKTIYEINSVVRMSFIEMQFIKKEMMNALYAMDQMIMSNEINMNLAAVTPAVMLIYSIRFFFRFLWYALLQIGKSREETYAQIRKIMLDVERLLVMRDKPPSAPPPLSESGGKIVEVGATSDPDVLTADDLGMLMLLLHECRTILWNDQHRFSPQVSRDVAEDLAELAGERGPVSVKQQLQIITRMYRTHSFMKVVSTGLPFDIVQSGKTF